MDFCFLCYQTNCSVTSRLIFLAQHQVFNTTNVCICTDSPRQFAVALSLFLSMVPYEPNSATIFKAWHCPCMACWQIAPWISLHRILSPASALQLKHDRPRKIPCLLFTLYTFTLITTTVASTQRHFYTSDWSDCSKQRKPRYFVVSIWRLITPLSNNIFSWNLVVLSQIYSETTALNFIKIYSDLTFLSHIV